MDLKTAQITSNQIVCHSDTQITLENDMNVPDSKPDIDNIIKIEGNISSNSVSALEGKVNVKGTLDYFILYASNDDIVPIHNLSGSINFDESVGLDNVSEGDEINCHFEIDDCQANLINSRKLSINAIIGIHCCKPKSVYYEAVSSMVSDDETDNLNLDGLYSKMKTVTYTHLVIQKNDIHRIFEELTLPKAKPSIASVLYYNIRPLNIQTKVVEDGVRLMGDLNVFVLYTPENEERSLEYFETEVSFDEIINCNDCNEDMIPDIDVSVGTRELSSKPDEDGENRIVNFELTLKLQMKFYENREAQILDDAYSTAMELEPVKEKMLLNKLIMKNQSSLRLSEQISLESPDKILQICNATGKITIDEQQIVDGGIHLDGVLLLDILYMTENDASPLSIERAVLPFSHIIEIDNLSTDCYYELQFDINNINVIMIDSSELEVKVNITLCAIAFSSFDESFVSDIVTAPLDFEQLHKLPGIVGYYAAADTPVWDIAKKYRTTVKSIMDLNEINGDTVHKGDKLLLLKMVEGI